MNSEQQRIAFIEDRDGSQAAMNFVKTTYDTYRRSLTQSRKRGHQKPHHASLPEYRPGFIRSCVEFRAYMYRKAERLGPNCDTCDYKRMNVNRDGHCCMFKEQPEDCGHYKSVNVMNVGTIAHIGHGRTGLALAMLNMLSRYPVIEGKNEDRNSGS